MKPLLVIILFTQSLCYAQKIEYIQKETPAPYEGFLVDPPQMKKFREINEKSKLYQEKNIKLEELAKVQDEEIQKAVKKQEEALDELDKEKDRSFLKTTGGFILGAVLTGLISVTVIKYIRK